MPGDASTLYSVKLLFRGVVEVKTYNGGSNDGANFQIGGVPQSDAWNVYSLTVSNPPQTYYLNRGTSGQNSVFEIDYTATILIAGGATVQLAANSIDNSEIANNIAGGGPISVPGITNPSQPYVGQFIAVDYLGSTILSSSTIPLTTTTTQSVIVNYPTTLPRFFGGNGLGTLERQNLFSGDFLVTGSVVKSASDPYIGEQPVSYMEAFNESARHEQDQLTLTSSFYATGSSLTYVSEGFDQPLRSKTQVKVSFPVAFSTTMPGLNSSIYYYNGRAKVWEVPNNSSYVVANQGTLPPAPNFVAGGDWASPNFDGYAGRITEDSRGFGPIGNIVSSGSHVPQNAADQTDSAIGSTYVFDTLSNVVGKQYNKSIRNNEEYRAAADETFTLPINAPFLIEKAVFEIPLSMGPGWFKDLTQAFLPGNSAIDSGTAFDFAGPAMTIALHRQIQLSADTLTPSRRDLILTGTITHAADNTSNVIISNFPDVSDGTFQIRPVGFLSYAGPAGAVVSHDKRNAFTGSVTVQAEALSAAGIVLRYVRNFNSSSTTQNAQGIASLFSTPSLTLVPNAGFPATSVGVASVSPLGRAGTGFQQSGRAILGNEFVTFQGLPDPSGKTAANPFADVVLTAQQQALLASPPTGFKANAVAAISLVSHFPAPYLVLPGDKLVLSISKMRPVLFQPHASDGTPTPSTMFSGSTGHDVTLLTGTINMTLYGSQIQAGLEYHDTLNQPLASDIVHEIIGAEPVLDDFESAYRNEYSGSFTDNVNLGNLGIRVEQYTGVGGFPAHRVVQTFKDRKLSVLNARNALPLTNNYADALINPSKAYRSQPWYQRVGDVRLSQFADASERYWDSMMPAVDSCFAADGSGIFITPPGTFGDFRQVDPGISGSNAYYPGTTHPGWIMMDNMNPQLVADGYSPVINCNWNKSFPFEPRYAAVSRQLNLASSLLATYIYFPFNGTYAVESIPPTLINGFFFGTIGLGTEIINAPYVYVNGFNQVVVNHLYFEFANTPCFDWLSDVNVTSKITLNSGYVTPTMPSQVYPTGSANIDDTARMLFGFGDRNTCFQTTYNNETVLLGTNHFPETRDVEGPHPDGVFTYADVSNFRVSPLIRGWKYGVHSAIPTFSKSYWRRGRFGQFRDMLEQRPYGKFYQSPEKSPNTPNFQQGEGPGVVSVNFIDPNSGRLTAPDNTWSSNLHFECTSSLPFFDGVPLNRPPVITSKLNLHPNTVLHDGFGNIRIA